MKTSDNALPDLIPARMLNEYAYCPRLFYMEWVQGEFEHNEDTLYGNKIHQNVDKEGGSLNEPDDLKDDEVIHAKSIMLSSEKYEIISKLDLIEGEGNNLIPVDYKKGSLPLNEERSYEPDRVQICAQAIILRENGYQCQEGVIYYYRSKTRVAIPITDELITLTLKIKDLAKQTAKEGIIPQPLIDSHKCPRCSLVGICMPDEVTYLSNKNINSLENDEIRRLFPARDDALPLYVQEQGSSITKDGEELVIKNGKTILARAKIFETSSLYLFGNVQITTQTIHELCNRQIPITYFSYGGWFYGITHGMEHKNVLLRQQQYLAANNIVKSISLAKQFISGKIKNSRTLLRRNCDPSPDPALEELSRLVNMVIEAKTIDELLGIEGAAARVYFYNFDKMIKKGNDALGFDFHHRNRRPPKDPINALLSYTYALLTSTTTITLTSVGFDPYLGFYHQPRYGRPSLALDLIEEFRPLIADSTVLSLVNNREILPDEMIHRAGAVSMPSETRKKVIQAYERRLDTLISHPVLGYSISYRRVLEVQARLLGRYLTEEINEYPTFLTR